VHEISLRNFELEIVSFSKLLSAHFKTGSGSRAVGLSGQGRVTDRAPPSSADVFILYARSIKVHNAHVHTCTVCHVWLVHDRHTSVRSEDPVGSSLVSLK
jgi:hypothetical protein